MRLVVGIGSWDFSHHLLKYRMMFAICNRYVGIKKTATKKLSNLFWHGLRVATIHNL